MKNAAFICLVAAVLLIAGLYWRSPTQQASIGPVNISFPDLPESNTNGAMFLLSNGGPFELECQVYSQVYVSGRWREPSEGRSMDFPPLPVLQPTTAIIFRLSPPGGTDSWRAAVHCMRHYPNTDGGRRRFNFDWYVRKKAFIDTSYSERVSR